jgi:hypothetical protein
MNVSNAVSQACVYYLILYELSARTDDFDIKQYPRKIDFVDLSLLSKHLLCKGNKQAKFVLLHLLPKNPQLLKKNICLRW